MLVKIYSAAPVGIDAVKVTIEVHSKPGFDFIMVGLPDVFVTRPLFSVSTVACVVILGVFQLGLAKLISLFDLREDLRVVNLHKLQIIVLARRQFADA